MKCNEGKALTVAVKTLKVNDIYMHRYNGPGYEIEVHTYKCHHRALQNLRSDWLREGFQF
jgi:hypothetical protein